METYFEISDAFLYGETTTQVNDSPVSTFPKEALRRVAKGAVRTVAKISVSFLMFGTVAVSSLPASGVQNYVEAFTIERSEQPNVGVLRHLVKDARAYLEITQEELARMLNLSPSTIEKFEQGEVKEPTPAVFRKYTAVTLLTSIYRAKFGDKRFLVRHRVHEPSVYFGEKSLIEFAARQDDGIFLAVATEMRKYA